jgi:two-component system LytT family response regulator
MKRALLIDDEPLARMVVLEYLQAYKDKIEVIGECNDGFEGLKAIQQHQPDLVFLDVQMPKINGFEMLELVEQPPSVISLPRLMSMRLKLSRHMRLIIC